MIDELIRKISKQLNIPVNLKSEESLARLAYSVSGRMSIESLWNYEESEHSLSVQHFKKSVEQSISAFEQIFPQLKKAFPADKSILSQEILEIYQRNGFIYHSPYKLSPSIMKSCQLGSSVLYRGLRPGHSPFMSGLGFYDYDRAGGSAENIDDVFGLSKTGLVQQVEESISLEWEPVDWPDDTEFLRMEPPFYRGVWKNTPDRVNGRISMARYGDPVRIYVFYRFQEGQFNQQVIPSWRIQDYRSLKDSDTNYRIISSGLLLKNGTLPAIQAFDQGEFVSIQLQYQLPPAEEDFFKLYSWPLNFNESNLSLGRIYHRKMAKAIYPIFRAHLQSIGYTMEEHEICQKEQMPSTIS